MRVVNASPLIHLARVSLLDVLREPRGSVEVSVPELVLHEVMRGLRRDPTARSIEAASHDWLQIVPTPQPHPDINQTRIDAGEIAVLSVALLVPGATVVLDDLLARTEAERLGIHTPRRPPREPPPQPGSTVLDRVQLMPRPRILRQPSIGLRRFPR
jgi:uncharacterized protein